MTPSAGGRFDLVAYGPAALQCLAQQVDALQASDPLAAVDVVVPSGVVGMTVRRQIADPGLANVRFPQAVDLRKHRWAPWGSNPQPAD